MIPTHHPLERSLGICWYANDGPGTGGRLRSSPEDFVVEECETLPPLTGGPYLVCRLKKKNWEQGKAVRAISDRLGISHRRCSFAGTKDRRAVTTQAIALYNVTAEAVRNLAIPDLTLEPLGYANRGFALGDLAGNRFRIVVRECSTDDLEARVAAAIRVVSGGIPNYVGLQRFGVVRPITHIVGRLLVAGEVEGAVTAYIGLSYPTESVPVREAREAFEIEKNPRTALSRFPVPLRYERAMLHHLASSPGDFEGALRTLPPKLASMLVSAYQSHLFNRVLSARIARGVPLDEPEVGDRLVFSDGRTDVVGDRSVGPARMLVRRGRARVGIALPGSTPFEVRGETDATTQRLLEEDGVDESGFERAAALVGTPFSGAVRPIRLAATVRSRVGTDSYELSFAIGPGCYATTVCREFTKGDPLQMV
ncbi:MAG TPA: tRNA pseudouridine(13) synthase TruD [Methanoregulaceae archaeon]|nr:tRNA pseudouridine(13) synthase TruD [Methanoregulaceae archaeon]